MVIPVPIVAVLFQHGAFDRADTWPTALAVAVYGAGLPAFVMQKVISPLYYAREDTRSPFRFAVHAMIVNAAIALGLAPVHRLHRRGARHHRRRLGDARPALARHPRHGRRRRARRPPPPRRCRASSPPALVMGAALSSPRALLAGPPSPTRCASTRRWRCWSRLGMASYAAAALRHRRAAPRRHPRRAAQRPRPPRIAAAAMHDTPLIATLVAGFVLAFVLRRARQPAAAARRWSATCSPASRSARPRPASSPTSTSRPSSPRSA